ncbi:Peptidoglycan O-acetyltransferase [Symmachiella macrocystis]|uniref:Peptidoglycan O-acetyltransferase n=1 Tax=Symmachiella macrocystis TaxID=2527985 RepID=A0A5C6BA42_9PLAN|nr:MBOAT family protein [Symmachiella macrocystis]TWU08828.1 Peptidoglycan O-acetyltransferase [Symmachiella macrocystis]
MLFNSYAFLIFLPIVLAVYYCLNLRAQNLWLLAASWFFYGSWDYRFLGLLGISTVVDYFCGRWIYQSTNPRTRKHLLLVSIVTNLSILGFFKYYGFFVSSLIALLASLGIRANVPMLNILLPVGISFYTFQTMSYTIDIYRGLDKPCDSIATFALFVSYFPQLVAGPIERASSLLPQLSQKRTITGRCLREGLMLIVLGYFKKVGVADTLAPLVDTRFTYPDQATSADLLFSLYLFAIQIYCDFSGYTDIARGVSRLLGVRLMVNFAQPYFSTSITEFWRRWHISLSTWLRDYLYIPLGGNRHGTLITYRNLSITMLLGGLWHGASWNFIVWGALHGMYLSVDRLKHGSRPPISEWTWRNSWWMIVKMFVVFHLVCLAWIAFRAQNLPDALHFLEGIFAGRHNAEINEISWMSKRLLILIVTLAAIDICQRASNDHVVFLRLPTILQGAFVALLIALTLAFGGIDDQVPFIYFQF